MWIEPHGNLRTTTLSKEYANLVENIKIAPKQNLLVLKTQGMPIVLIDSDNIKFVIKDSSEAAQQL